jgi:hypothetical protein
VSLAMGVNGAGGVDVTQDHSTKNSSA